jgi:hypothetical protein
MLNKINLTSIFVDRPIKPCRKYYCKRCGALFYTRKCGVPKYCMDCRVIIYDEKHGHRLKKGKGISYQDDT